MNTIITIGRQFGSGGHQIGKLLAAELNIPFYDKELLDRAAKDSGLCKEIFENQDERPTNSFLYSLVTDSFSYGYTPGVMNDMPLNQKVFLAQFEAIRKMAEEGSCVIIGRCADYALEEDPNLLSVYVHANLEDRVARISRIYDISDNKARDRIKKNDKSRAGYYNYYTNKEWGSVSSYHYSLDSSKFGIQGCVELLKEAVRVKEAGNNSKISVIIEK